MKVIGLTGGMGSGKSTIARIFGSMGVPVFDSDSVAKTLYHTDQQLKSELQNLFGSDIYINDSLDRQKLGSLIFSDDALLHQLTSLVHPAVKRAFVEWKKTIPPRVPYLIRESAILFESQSHTDCDIVVTVNAPMEVRILRIKQRDGLDEESIIQRLDRQWTDIQRSVKADEVIINDGLHAVLPRVVELDSKWRTTSLTV